MHLWGSPGTPHRLYSPWSFRSAYQAPSDGHGSPEFLPHTLPRALKEVLSPLQALIHRGRGPSSQKMAEPSPCPGEDGHPRAQAREAAWRMQERQQHPSPSFTHILCRGRGGQGPAPRTRKRETLG